MYILSTVNHILLTLLYFSNLETHKNLTSINFGKDNTHNIQLVIKLLFTSSFVRENILYLLSHLQKKKEKEGI